MELTLDKRLKTHHEVVSGLRERFPSGLRSAAYLKEILSVKPEKSAAVYVHVPYCTKICTFCNMNRSLVDRGLASYHDKLAESIRKAARCPRFRDGSYRAVYFGGGTPTALSAAQLGTVLRALRDNLPIEKDAEITVETSVSDLTNEKASVLAALGVNRLSVGIQSFQDRARRILGRKGTGRDAAGRISELIAAGFENTGVDLIYNYPGQTEADLERDLQDALALDVSGASVYSLILMEGSPLERSVKERRTDAPAGLAGEEALFRRLLKRFRESGFEILEPTKLVRPGRDRYEYIRLQNSWSDILAFGRGGGGRVGNYAYFNGPAVPLPWPFPVSPMGLVASGEQVFLEKLAGSLQFGVFALPEPEGFTPPDDAQERFEALLGELEARGLVTNQGGDRGYTDEGLFWANTIGRFIITEAASWLERKK